LEYGRQIIYEKNLSLSPGTRKSHFI